MQKAIARFLSKTITQTILFSNRRPSLTRSPSFPAVIEMQISELFLFLGIHLYSFLAN